MREGNQERSAALEELDALQGGLVVSCQAADDSPLHGPLFMAAMAAAVVQGGAVGIRANGPADVAQIRHRVSVPIIGINKVRSSGSTFITPSRNSAGEVVDAGARMVAVDATMRARPGGDTLAQIIAYIHSRGALVLGDVSTFDEGVRAVELGVDAIGTTLSGYTPYSLQQDGPDLELVERLAVRCPVPVFAEGRIWTPEQAKSAFSAGASFVVIGTAITNPRAITQRYVAAIQAEEKVRDR